MADEWTIEQDGGGCPAWFLIPPGRAVTVAKIYDAGTARQIVDLLNREKAAPVMHDDDIARLRVDVPSLQRSPNALHETTSWTADALSLELRKRNEEDWRADVRAFMAASIVGTINYAGCGECAANAILAADALREALARRGEATP